MSEKEKNALKELCINFKKLTEADRIRITGIAEGMVIARELAPKQEKEKNENESKN